MRFHLSTLLVAVIIIGAFLGLNLRERHVEWMDDLTPYKGQAFGWPFDCYYTDLSWGVLHGGSLDEPECVPKAIIGNLLVCATLILSAVLLFERLRERRLFQFQLTTAVALMFAGGFFVFLNASATQQYDEHDEYGDPIQTQGQRIFGWPQVFRSEFILFQEDDSEKPPQQRSYFLKGYNIISPEAFATAVGADAGVAFACLVIVGILCEWFVRRREAGRT